MNETITRDVTYRLAAGGTFTGTAADRHIARDCDGLPTGTRYVGVWTGTTFVPVTAADFVDGPGHLREWLTGGGPT